MLTWFRYRKEEDIPLGRGFVMLELQGNMMGCIDEKPLHLFQHEQVNSRDRDRRSRGSSKGSSRCSRGSRVSSRVNRKGSRGSIGSSRDKDWSSSGKSCKRGYNCLPLLFVRNFSRYTTQTHTCSLPHVPLFPCAHSMWAWQTACAKPVPSSCRLRESWSCVGGCGGSAFGKD